MREWDADGSGMVGVSELSAAAHAYKKAFLCAVPAVAIEAVGC